MPTNASFIRRTKTKEKRERGKERRRGDSSQPMLGVAPPASPSPAQPSRGTFGAGGGGDPEARGGTSGAGVQDFPAGLGSGRHCRGRVAGQAFPVGVSSSSLQDTLPEGEELADASVRAAGCGGRASGSRGESGRLGALCAAWRPGNRGLLLLSASVAGWFFPLVLSLAVWNGSASVSNWL